VKNHVWVFLNALIENPTFDSQTKENMTLQAKSFGSHCSLSDKFINAVGNIHHCCFYLFVWNARNVLLHWTHSDNVSCINLKWHWCNTCWCV